MHLLEFLWIILHDRNPQKFCIGGWFSLDAFLSWTISWFTSLVFSWTTSLAGTLRVIVGEVALLNIYARVVNVSLCLFTGLYSGFDGDVFCSK